MIRRPGLLLSGLLFVAVPLAGARDEPVARALEDEMKRTVEELRVGDRPPPYFVAYRVDDIRILEIGASFGSPLRRRSTHDRVLSVEVRVGSPELDNTNFFSLGGRGAGLARSWNGSTRIPLADSYRELRRQIWLLTDAAYKFALENLGRKRATLANRRVPGDLPDFSEAEPAVVEEIISAAAVDADVAERLAVEVSRRFRRHAGIDASEVHVRRVQKRSRYLNSEGSSFIRSVPLMELVIAASTQAADGTRLADAIVHYGRATDDLPALEALKGEVDLLAARLTRSRDAEEIERYNGPVLFTRQAAAELFHQVFAPELSGWRPPVAEDERLERRLAEIGSSLNDRLGGRVLARSMRLEDDALAEEAHGSRLFGGFRVDDDGVPAGRTLLVERGILKRLVSGRNPSRGVEGSTGNRRGGSALASNLLLSTSEGLSETAIRKELLQLMEERDLEFGVVVHHLANPILLGALAGGGAGRGRLPSEAAIEGVTGAVKIYRDGREEPIRSPRFSGLSVASFRDIVAASDRHNVYSAPLRSEHAAVSVFGGTLGSILIGPPVVSVVVPDLLFEELTITAPVGPVPKPPAMPHPYFAD